ncbi:peptidyl-prolyl cis-trans isomerase cyclophilin type [Catenulispora acidiphila DSM 44928]|uniref:Peptidyl-prolyl cis-trans isomerase n=1 Tax=Catenulispora acidiphila (strain DSM 44928 / JCM 14897 / NBRC 102108 / NRRL B-24433 / ID139908) TaxID=479433 RepID=C7Q8P6_CATAD|nr:peptidylprolyl isomerase [Catenulispora acidiphila]ACU70311.1 peptidyl-prolyl cis-trans isomerase cyclophilin type [Catenulispora acidiphila DSM 44928]
MRVSLRHGRYGRWAVLAAAGALALAGCSSSGSAKGSTGGSAPQGAPSSTSTASSAASGGTAAGKQWSKEPAMTIDASKKYTMVLHTSQGDITIAMDAAKAPHTVNSFNFLAGQHFFDGSYCHRLSTSAGLQMLQCGDPTAGATPKDTDGSNGPGYTFQDENLSGATYPAGTVAMANAGPNTNGSQFFLVFGDSQLAPNYTPFGTITDGMGVLVHVSSGGISNPGQDGTGRPTVPVELKSVSVTAG